MSNFLVGHTRKNKAGKNRLYRINIIIGSRTYLNLIDSASFFKKLKDLKYSLLTLHPYLINKHPQNRHLNKDALNQSLNQQIALELPSFVPRENYRFDTTPLITH